MAIDIIGPNSYFVDQSGTLPGRFTDFSPEDSTDKVSRAEALVKAAFDEIGGVPVTPESTALWRILGGLGSHDFSVMREALGMPEKVVGSALGFPFWKYVIFSPFVPRGEV